MSPVFRTESILLHFQKALVVRRAMVVVPLVASKVLEMVLALVPAALLLDRDLAMVNRTVQLARVLDTLLGVDRTLGHMAMGMALLEA